MSTHSTLASWLLVGCAGILGAVTAEMLDAKAAITGKGKWPWDMKRPPSAREPLGVAKYVTVVVINLVLGGLAAAVARGTHQSLDVFSLNGFLTLAAAGLSAPAVLQKAGGALGR